MMQETQEKYKSVEIFKNLETVSKELKERKQQLTAALSLADRKRTDIEHYIEFYPLSASQGYKAAKMLKDCLEERRNIKNELEIIEDVLRMSIGFIGKGKGSVTIQSVENKKYTPRVIKELFQ